MSSKVIDSIEYSVCEDCLLAVAHGHEGDHDITEAVERELAGREGHFSTGIEPTEEDPDGNGYEEFCVSPCDLCHDHLAGNRHGVTLLLLGENDEGLNSDQEQTA